MPAPLSQVTYEDGTTVMNIAPGTATLIKGASDYGTQNTTEPGDYSNKSLVKTGTSWFTYDMSDGNFPSGDMFTEDFSIYFSLTGAQTPTNTRYIAIEDSNAIQYYFGFDVLDPVILMDDLNIDWSGGGGFVHGTPVANLNNVQALLTFSAVNKEVNMYTSAAPDPSVPVLTNSFTTISTSGTPAKLLGFFLFSGGDPVEDTLEEIRVYDFVPGDPEKFVTSVTDYHVGINTEPTLNYGTIETIL